MRNIDSQFRIPHSAFEILHLIESSRVDSNHRSTACKAAAFAARPRDDYLNVPHSEFNIPNFKKYPTEESNLVQLFRRQSCVHHTRKVNIVWWHRLPPCEHAAHRLEAYATSKSGREIRTLTTCFKGKSPVLGIPECFVAPRRHAIKPHAKAQSRKEHAN